MGNCVIMKNKLLFWLDADLTHFGLAKFLQEKGEFDIFGIFDITNKPKKFFNEQKIVDFQKRWFYHEHIIKTSEKIDLNYLRDFEEKYKINLWLLAYNERIFFRFNEYHKFKPDEILKILEQECKLFEKILDEVKPEFMLMRAADLHQNQLFYELCKAKKIKVLMLGQTRFASRVIISSLWHEIDVEDDVKISKNRTVEELYEFLKGADTFKQVTNYTTKFQKSNRGKISAIKKFLLSKNTNEKTHFTYFGRTKGKVICKELTYVLKRKFRENFINKNLVRKIENSESFFYFPLHLDQESTLLIGGPFFTNQIEIIRHIVKSLPVGYSLYVKEHPAMKLRGWHKTSEYKEIMELPNVVLIHPNVKPEEILKKCDLVISIASTASLEAAFYGKPSIIFAHSPYSTLSSVYRLKNIEELPMIIRKALNTKVEINDLNKYINYVEKNSFQLDLIKIELGYARIFYHDGNLVDVEISEKQMNAFLDEFQYEFEILANEHLKKMNLNKKYDL